MPTPLAASYAPTVLWQQQCRPPEVERRRLPKEAEVVVIGAGYCGLAAAHELAGSGVDPVVVLDSHQLGWGASTRNGGMVIPELKADADALEREYGPLGRRLHDAVEEAFDWLESLVTEGGIECDYERTGQLYLAHHRRLLPKLRRLAAAAAARGEAVRMVERDELATEIGSTTYPGGVVLERTGGLHPARLHAGLVARAAAAGVELHDHTPVTQVQRDPSGGFVVVTRRGRVRCRDVIAATNAYADQAMPWLARRVLPVGSYIIATERLPGALAHEISPRRRMFVDTKNFLFYWRLTPDRRMLFGGRRSLLPTSLDQARDFLYDAMTTVHPQLAGRAIEHAWGGSVAITLDRMPHVGHADGVLYATGCNGSGVALNTWLGMRLARMLQGDDPPPFAELPHRPIPMRRLRAAYLPAASLWLRWQDRGFPTR